MRPWHWPPGHLVRKVYGPRYLEHDLEEDDTQALSVHIPRALCALDLVRWGIAKGRPKWGPLSHGSQNRDLS